MKKMAISIAIFVLLLFFSANATWSAIFIFDPGGPGESNSPASAYYQLFDPAGTYPAALPIDLPDFSPAFNTSDGTLFNISIDHRGNNNDPGYLEDWGFKFYADGTNLTSTHHFSNSPDASGFDVVDTFGPFDLSNVNWKLEIQELSTYTNRGFKLDSVTLSNVPIPAAVWLLGSGLIGLVGFRKKFKR